MCRASSGKSILNSGRSPILERHAPGSAVAEVQDVQVFALVVDPSLLCRCARVELEHVAELGDRQTVGKSLHHCVA